MQMDVYMSFLSTQQRRAAESRHHAEGGTLLVMPQGEHTLFACPVEDVLRQEEESGWSTETILCENSGCQQILANNVAKSDVYRLRNLKILTS